MCIECAGQAITLNKEYVRPLLSRASAYYELEKYEEANEGRLSHELYNNCDRLSDS